jgi:hypothetical protein
MAGGQPGQAQLFPQMSYGSMHRASGRYPLNPAVQALAKFIRIALNTGDTGAKRASVDENVSGRQG